jgi:hypothetical protein
MLPRCNGDVIAKCARAKNHVTQARHVENNNEKEHGWKHKCLMSLM